MTRKALITGLTGQDGSYLAELLLVKGYQVFGLVLRSSSSNFDRISHLSGNIQILSGEVFGQPDESSQTERTAFRPRNPYGVAKAYTHWMTVNYRHKYNLYACCGIIYTHESPRQGYRIPFS